MVKRTDDFTDYAKRTGITSTLAFRQSLSRIRGEACLWRAVILQAFADATTHSQKPEAHYERHAARAWLTGGSQDFKMVCDYAELDASYIRRLAKQCLLQRKPRRLRSRTAKKAAIADKAAPEPRTAREA